MKKVIGSLMVLVFSLLMTTSTFAAVVVSGTGEPVKSTYTEEVQSADGGQVDNQTPIFPVFVVAGAVVISIIAPLTTSGVAVASGLGWLVLIVHGLVEKD